MVAEYTDKFIMASNPRKRPYPCLLFSFYNTYNNSMECINRIFKGLSVNMCRSRTKFKLN